MSRRLRTRIEEKKPHEWALTAAQNAVSILPALSNHSEPVPDIRVEDVAARIETAFQSQAGWNRAVIESVLEPEEKIWLIVP